MNLDPRSPRTWAIVSTAALVAIALVVGLFLGLGSLWRGYDRYQTMADAKNNAKVSLVKANNNVTVTNIEIKNQEQRVQVARQKAQIRLEEAKGIRAAQDSIAETLTPLYVQHTMVEALESIAKSGKNSTVVYIPSGPGGVPIIAPAAGAVK